MPRQKTQKTTETMEHWRPLIATYYEFCKEKFGAHPSFDGSTPRDMRAIVAELRKRTLGEGLEWTLEEAQARWLAFLNGCYADAWLSRNFVMSNLNRFKDKIFLNTARQGRPQITQSGADTGTPDVNYNEIQW